jgi:hypothetical protein
VASRGSLGLVICDIGQNGVICILRNGSNYQKKKKDG